MAVNFIANQRLIRALHPLLRASDAGRAVFLTSGVATRIRAPIGAPYAARKAALEALVNSLRGRDRHHADPGQPVQSRRRRAPRCAPRRFPAKIPMTLPTPEEVAPAIVAMLQPGYAENGARVQFKR